MMLTDCPDNAKCIIQWSLQNGLEIARTTRSDDVLSFAWSRDGRLLATRTLAETRLPEGCGMIKFSPDFRSLFCFRGAYSTISNLFRFNINVVEHPSCTLHVCCESLPWEFESWNEAGFLSGDPISSSDVSFDFLLKRETVLRGYPYRRSIDILTINERRKSDREATLSSVKKIVFSWSGEIVYVVSDAVARTVRAWHVSSGKLIAEKNIGNASCHHHPLAAVKEGVLIQTWDNLELWNLELSKCIRRLFSVPLYGLRYMIAISEELVAYEKQWKKSIHPGYQ